MIRKYLIIIILLFSFSPKLFSQENFVDRLEFAIEWGYSQNIYNNFSYTVQSAAEGYKLKESGSRLFLYPHLRSNLRCSYIFNENNSASLLIGTMGIGQDTNVYPLLLRYTYYNRSIHSDSLFSFFELGYGLHKPNGLVEDEAFLADLAEGYRLNLSSRCSLDFILLLSFAYNKPQIPNPDGPGFISNSYVLSNFAENYAISFMFSLNF